MKRIGTFFLLATFLFVSGVSLFAAPAREMPREHQVVREVVDHELILLHTNDHHGRTLAFGGQGGLAERAAYISGIRAAFPNVLLVDAGDFNTGTALSNMFTAEPDILAYNIMGYDAVTFGNHEFNHGMERLERQMALATFPFVSSNVRRADGQFIGGNQYLIKEYGGLRVGIFGITTLRTLDISSPGLDVTFINEIDATREVVNILRNRERVDIVIGLTHIGTIEETPAHITSQRLAAAVPGIDIIVDGHSHTRMERPLRVGNTYIVQAHEWGREIGQGRLRIRNGRLVSFDWSAVPIGPNAEVVAMLRPFVEQADRSIREVIGAATDTFIFGNRLTRYQETSLGNAITDANVWYFRDVANLDIDFAFHNGGNIRAELPAGPVTMESILNILPFDNFLYIVSMQGSEILELFDFIATIPQGNGGFPQFSSEVRYTLDVPNRRVTNLTIGGAPVDPNRMYRFCTNSFLLGGGDGYQVLGKAREPYNTSLLLSFVVGEAVRTFQNITPYYDGRMNIIGGVTP